MRHGEAVQEEMGRGLGEASPWRKGRSEPGTLAEIEGEGENGEVEIGRGVGSGGGVVGDGGIDGTGDGEEVGTAAGGSASGEGGVCSLDLEEEA